MENSSSFLYTFLFLLRRLVCACDGIALDYCPFLVGWLAASSLVCVAFIWYGVVEFFRYHKMRGDLDIEDGFCALSRRVCWADDESVRLFVCGTFFLLFFSFRVTKLVLNQAH